MPIRVLFEGSSSREALYIGLAKKFARYCIAYKISNKTWLIQGDAQIRCEWYGGNNAKAWIKVGEETGFAGLAWDSATAAAPDYDTWPIYHGCGWVLDDNRDRAPHPRPRSFDFDDADNLYGVPGTAIHPQYLQWNSPEIQPGLDAADQETPSTYATLHCNATKLNKGRIKRDRWVLCGNQTAYKWQQSSVDDDGNPVYAATDPVVSWWHSPYGDGPLHHSPENGFTFAEGDGVSGYNFRWPIHAPYALTASDTERATSYEVRQPSGSGPWYSYYIAGAMAYCVTQGSYGQGAHAWSRFVFPSLYRNGRLVHRFRFGDDKRVPMAQVAGVYVIGAQRALVVLTVDFDKAYLVEAPLSAKDPYKSEHWYGGVGPLFYEDRFDHAELTADSIVVDYMAVQHAHLLHPWRFSEDGTKVSTIARVHCYYDKAPSSNQYANHVWVPRIITAHIDLEERIVTSVDVVDYIDGDAVSGKLIGLNYLNNQLVFIKDDAVPPGPSESQFFSVLHADARNNVLVTARQDLDVAGYYVAVQEGDTTTWIEGTP